MSTVRADHGSFEMSTVGTEFKLCEHDVETEYCRSLYSSNVERI